MQKKCPGRVRSAPKPVVRVVCVPYVIILQPSPLQIPAEAVVLTVGTVLLALLLV